MSTSWLTLLLLYIVRFLHQTTTPWSANIFRCLLYIVRFLHQTTTSTLRTFEVVSCISSVSYIKPQLYTVFTFTRVCCISSVSYIKPQPVLMVYNVFISCISSVSYIKPQPIISNKLYTNILLILFMIKNGCVGFVYIAKILKKLQLNRFADDFFCDFA